MCFKKTRHTGASMSNKSKLFIDRKSISHFRMKKTKSVRVVQHSRTLLRVWWANCIIKLSLFYGPIFIQIQIVLISEIEDVSRYVVPYTGKRHNMSQAEIDAFQNINMK
jgi:hypothetical protein